MEEGFVLVDALVAVAVVAAAGTVIYTLGEDVLKQQDRRLDRSVALINLKALVQQFSVIEATDQSGEVGKDELFTYAILSVPDRRATGSLPIVTLEARPRRGGDVETVAFLAPAVPP